MYTDHEIRVSVGLSDPRSAVFIKQYGEKRTCTNAIRALIIQNFSNVFVLMHILGDKHAASVDLAELYESVRHDSNAAWQFVVSATYAAPAETTSRGSYSQMCFMRALAEPIFEAFRAERFFYLICVRDPYLWAGGVLRYLGWPPDIHSYEWNHAAAAAVLRDACWRFNERYRDWLTLHRRYVGRSLIVHGERVSSSSSLVLSEIERQMKLIRDVPEFIAVSRAVDPTHWDFMKSCANEDWFDPRPKPTGFRLTESLHTVVSENVDWSLMDAFGYQIQPFTVSAD